MLVQMLWDVTLDPLHTEEPGVALEEIKGLAQHLIAEQDTKPN
jgi:hypothetical protein